MTNIRQGDKEVYTIKKARRRGAKDGRRWEWNSKPPYWPLVVTKPPIPADADDKSPHFEATLVGVVQHDIQKISQEWADEDQKLLPEYCRAKADHDMKVGQLGREDHEKLVAATTFQRLKEDFLSFPPSWIKNTKVYWAIVSIIIAGEGFFNFSVFRLFGTADLESWMMACAIVVTIPLAAEVVGHHLKAERKTRGGIIGSGVVLFVLVALFVALAVLRDKFLQTNADTRIPIDETTLVFILIVFNLAFFAVMTFLAYTQARPNYDEYKTAKNRYEDAERNANMQTRESNEAEKALADARERLGAARAKRERQFEAHRQNASGLIETCGILISEYRGANVAARALGQATTVRPPCFESDPKTLLKMPANLESIEWVCPEQKDIDFKPMDVTSSVHSAPTQGPESSKATVS